MQDASTFPLLVSMLLLQFPFKLHNIIPALGNWYESLFTINMEILLSPDTLYRLLMMLEHCKKLISVSAVLH